jgi:DNA-binding PadR family transcriptional regulator
MLLAQKGEQKIEDYIVEILHSKEASGPTLLKEISKNDPGISKETFYRILRKLLNEEVLNKQNKIYQLNRHWLQRVYRFGKKHIEENQGIDAGNILSFEEGDKISYKFKNPNLMGIYWAHTGDMIYEKHDRKIPILVYHPHEWLIYGRVISETFFLSRFKDDKKLVFFAVGGNTDIDKKFKKDWDDKYRQISINANLGLKNNEYINVFGDFIFKVTVGKKFAEDINNFFKKNKIVSESNRKELEDLCNRNETSKMILTRSKKEADKWRAKFNKHFYIPK